MVVMNMAPAAEESGEDLKSLIEKGNSAYLDDKELIALGRQSLDMASVLGIEELKELETLMPEIQHAIYTRTIWRTETEMRFSVLNDMDHPTTASKYHQAKLEMAVFAENLIQLSFEYRLKKIEFDETLDKMKSAERFEKLKLEVERDKLRWTLEAMRIEANHRLRELKLWHKIMTELVSSEKFDIDDKDTQQLTALLKRYLQELPVALRSKNDTSANRNIIAHTITLIAECDRRKIKSQEIERGRKLLRCV